MRCSSLIAGLGLLTGFAEACPAAFVQLTEVITASGTFGPTAFTNSTVTITALVDSSRTTYTPGEDIYVTPLLSLNVAVSGVGSAQVSNPGSVVFYFYPTATQIYFYGGYIPGGDGVFSGFQLPMTGYHLDGPIAPTVGGGGFGYGPHQTALGVFTVTSAASTATFSAQVVPEPASLALVACGLGLAGAVGRRRRRAG